MTSKNYWRKNAHVFNWLISVDKGYHVFPGGRGVFKFGLKNMALQGCGGNLKLICICIDPEVNSLTYLQHNRAVPAIKSLFIQQDIVVKDFSENIEYFVMDLEHNGRVKIWLTDHDGDELDVKGELIFTVQHT